MEIELKNCIYTSGFFWSLCLLVLTAYLNRPFLPQDYKDITYDFPFCNENIVHDVNICIQWILKIGKGI